MIDGSNATLALSESYGPPRIHMVSISYIVEDPLITALPHDYQATNFFTSALGAVASFMSGELNG